MARPKKKPAVDLSALEHLPRVLEALRYLAGMADEVGRTAPRVGLGVAQTPFQTPGGLGKFYSLADANRDMDRMDAARAPVVLDTPERREWLQQQADVASAIREERAKTTPTPTAKLPAAQRAAIEKGLMVDTSRKAALMANFKHDGAPEAETINGTEEIQTLSEAT
jgi:hypothetical protein